MRTLAFFLILLPSFASKAQEAPLPPVVEWSGKSRSLIVEESDPWITPSETTGLTETPSYQETVTWLERLVAAAPELRIVTIGTSAQQRPIVMIIASADGASGAEELFQNGKPTVLAHSGIHSGEIDGKDAGLMLLRDLTVADRLDLLERVNLLFIPVLNVDGHERRSEFGRINQRGPREMGWRTNARNLNLNRDFTKLDTEGVRALVGVFNEYDPDLYIDLHVTDGEDYQYDITWGHNGEHAHSPAIARWLARHFDRDVTAALQRAGHVPGPLVFGTDPLSLEAGIPDWTADPRFSHGYGDARHIPSILVENHSLDPYDQRVLGTYVLLEAALRTTAANSIALADAIESDRARRPDSFPLSWSYGTEPARTIDFLGVEMKPRLSEISGGLFREYTGRKITITVPVYAKDQVAAAASAPAAWWIPGQWREVIDIVRHHGIELETIAEPKTLELEMDRLHEPKVDEMPFEGRVRLTAGATTEVLRVELPPGSVRVPADQPLGDLAAILLEPASPDSLFQWGFFHPILSRTEYIEDYVVEPLAKQMLESDPALREEYIEALRSDPDLRESIEQRRRWFYERSPWYDDHYLLYPVGRETATPESSR